MAQAPTTRAKLSLRRKRLDEARLGRLTAKAIGSRAGGAGLPGGGAEAEETPRPDSRSPGGEEGKAAKESPEESPCLQHITSSSAVRTLEGGAQAEVVEPADSKQISTNGGSVLTPASVEQDSTNPIKKFAKTETSLSGVNQSAQKGLTPQYLVGGEEERGEGGEGGSDDQDRDFKVPVPLLRAQKKRRQEMALSNLDQEQLQLAMALSASLHPQATPADLNSVGPGKRGRKANKRDFPPPKLLAISAAESKQRLAQRATDMLLEAQVVADGGGRQYVAPPAFPPSTLAGRSGGGGGGGEEGEKRKPLHPTLWEMTSYRAGEGLEKFYVPALALPLSEKSAKHVPQPSPVDQCQSSPASLPSSHPSPPSLPSSHPSPPSLSSSHPSHPHPPPPSHSSLPQQTHPSIPLLPGVDRLLSDLSSLVGSPLCSDVVINTGDGRGIPAHSAILVCRCPMLAERLVQCADKPVHLDFSQFGRDTVVSFLNYLYTGSIPHGHGIGPVTMLAMSLGMRGCGLGPGRPATPPSKGGGKKYKSAESAHPPARHMPSADHVPGAELEMDSDVMATEGGSTHATPHSDGCRTSTTDRPLPPQATPTTGPHGVCEVQPSLAETQSDSTTTAIHLSPTPSHPLPSTPSLRSHSPPLKTTSPDIISVPSSPGSGGCHDTSRGSSVELLGSPHSPPPLLERITAAIEKTHADSLPPEPPDCSTAQDSPRGGACVGRRRKNKICGKMGEDEGTAAVLATPASPTTAQPSHTSHPAHPPTLPPHSSHPAQIPTLTPHTSAPVPQPHATPVPQLPLQSDDNITPTPNYRNMATPTLKEECSRFGVRALPKRKMIRKLEEIYDYTHPLVDAEGREVPAAPPHESCEGGRKIGRKQKRKETSELPASSTMNTSWEELVSKVKEVITMDTELHEDMVLYKPLELSQIQSRLKTASLSLSRETLMSVLDHLCVTFSVPRQQNKSNQEQES